MAGDRNRPSTKISPEEMRDALGRSGYLVEARVSSVFERRGFMAESNASYPDPTTGTLRELDVFANRPSHLAQDIVKTISLCECVNNLQPLVFIVREASFD